jgi:hypothetical protein
MRTGIFYKLWLQFLFDTLSIQHCQPPAITTAYNVEKITSLDLQKLDELEAETTFDSVYPWGIVDTDKDVHSILVRNSDYSSM